MDQTRDLNGQQLYRLTSLYPPPDFVKKADVGAFCGDHDKLPPHVYGDPLHRLYPCHTAAATWASTAFFMDKQAQFSPADGAAIAERLEHFAALHGITHSIIALKEKIAANRPEPDAALPDDDFAVVICHLDGTKLRRYPMRNGKEVQAAARYLEQHRDAMPYTYRQQLADKILQKSAHFGARLGALDDLVEKQAGHGACSGKECAEFLLNRVYAGRQGPGPLSNIQTELLKLAQMVARRPSTVREPGALCKIAAVVDDFDRYYGLVKDYGPGLPRIEDVLFGLTREKMAAVTKNHTATLTGSIYKLADLEMIKVSDIRSCFGDDIADAFTSDGMQVDSEKAAEVIPTLPRGDAEMFDRLMEDLGVIPMAKEASAYTTGISHEYLQKLAAMRKVP